VPSVPALVAAAALATAAAAAGGWLHACARLRGERLQARLARARQTTLLEGVRRLGAAATRSVDAVRAELEAAIRRLAPAVDAVLIFDEEDGQLACVRAGGARVGFYGGARIARRPGSSLPAAALERGHRVTLGESALRGLHPADAFAIAVPLPRGDAPAGVLYAAAPQVLDAAAAAAIAELAYHAAFAYALAHEREADRRRAEYDALTGLLAPRALRERLTEMLETARFAPLGRVALLFVDTDGFKAWNDAYGHASGDALLRSLAAELRAAAGAGDVAARNGGDEFCLVLAGTEKSRAIERAEALRARIAALELAPLRPAGGAGGVCITASIGVAAYPADAASASALLERADEAMYHSKRGGRNAVSYFGLDGALLRAAAAAQAVS
jgi:diguanylate cyclase (GGDEF)-like protein